MKRKTFDWLVTAYDKNDKVEEVFIIKDRTEHEAENEASADVGNFPDWTMVKAENEVKRFIKEFGYTHKEAKNLEGFSGGASAESECLINVGYVWVDKFRKWINKNNSSYDLRDGEVVDYIRKKYCN
jgi:hypothetical protein